MSIQSFRLAGTRRALGCVVVLVLALLAGLSPEAALAAGVDDAAGLFSPVTQQQAAQEAVQIEQATGKTVQVVTVANLGGQDIQARAEQYRDQQRFDGLLVYIARDERQLAVVIGPSAAQAITPQEQAAIRDRFLSQFSRGDYDAGLLAGLSEIGLDLQTPAPSSGSRFGLSGPFVIFLVVAAAMALTLLLLLRHSNLLRPEPTGGATSQRGATWSRGRGTPPADEDSSR